MYDIMTGASKVGVVTMHMVAAQQRSEARRTHQQKICYMKLFSRKVQTSTPSSCSARVDKSHCIIASGTKPSLASIAYHCAQQRVQQGTNSSLRNSCRNRHEHCCMRVGFRMCVSHSL